MGYTKERNWDKRKDWEDQEEKAMGQVSNQGVEFPGSGGWIVGGSCQQTAIWLRVNLERLKWKTGKTKLPT